MRPILSPLIIAFIATLFLLPGCARKPDLTEEINFALAGTLTALPTSTPHTTITPSPSLETLAGLFCEYQFCLGHPSHVAFFDVNAQRNPASPNSYNQGILAAYDVDLFIEVIWQSALPTSDPQTMLDLILEEGVDSRDGSLDVILAGDLNVFYTALSTTATPLLPNGGAAAWICGDRAFAWKVYTTGEARSETLLEQALLRFRCN
jgi:hypothetical protein